MKPSTIRKKIAYSDRLPLALKEELGYLFTKMDENFAQNKSQTVSKEDLFVVFNAASMLSKKNEDEDDSEINKKYLNKIIFNEDKEDINFDEFIQLMEAGGILCDPEMDINNMNDYDMKYAFQLFSQDEEKIGIEDLRKIADEIGEKIDDKELELMIKLGQSSDDIENNKKYIGIEGFRSAIS